MDTPAAWCVPPTATPDERAIVIFRNVYDGLRDPGVRAIAAELRGVRDPVDRAAAVLARSQAAGFTPDVECDRYAPVAFTLAHGGDCDDLAPVAICLAYACGLEAALVYMPQPAAAQDHVTAMIRAGGAWYWAEPSLPEARLGEHPYAAVARLGHGTRLFGGTGAVDPAVAGLAPLARVAALAGAIVAGVVAVGVAGAYVAARPTIRDNPFAGYRDFAVCEREASRRGVADPGAYCGTIERRAHGG